MKIGSIAHVQKQLADLDAEFAKKKQQLETELRLRETILKITGLEMDTHYNGRSSGIAGFSLDFKSFYYNEPERTQADVIALLTAFPPLPLVSVERKTYAPSIALASRVEAVQAGTLVDKLIVDVPSDILSVTPIAPVYASINLNTHGHIYGGGPGAKLKWYGLVEGEIINFEMNASVYKTSLGMPEIRMNDRDEYKTDRLNNVAFGANTKRFNGIDSKTAASYTLTWPIEGVVAKMDAAGLAALIVKDAAKK